MSTGMQIYPEFIIEKDIEMFFKKIYGDENRFTQIFLNFLSNAFKFCKEKEGKIQVEIRRSGKRFYHKIQDKTKI